MAIASAIHRKDRNSCSLYHILSVVILLIAGSALRIIAANGELWLDEVWNIKSVQKLHSVFDVYLVQKGMDGHSSLFSCILFLFSPNLPNFIYRVPSLLFSILTLLVLYFNTSGSPQLRFLTLLFFSSSYLFILYGIEARGYSGMILCLALGHTSFLRLTTTPPPLKLRDALIFIVSSCLGFLFHYSFIMWFVGAGIAYAISATLNPNLLSRRRLISFLVPTIFIAFIYFIIVRHLPPGDGPHPSYFHTFLNLMSVTLGGVPLSNKWPTSVFIVFLLAFLFLWITSKEVTELFKENRCIATYYLFSILIAPIAFTVIMQPTIVMPRYYLTSAFVFTALFASHVHRTRAKIPPLVFLSCNLLLTCHLIRWHHGNYTKVISRVTESTEQQGPVTIAVDHQFRHSMMLDYYGNNKVKVLESSRLKDSDILPVWYLAHDLDWGATPTEEVTLENKATYKLDMVTPSTLLSGWTTFLYRKK